LNSFPVTSRHSTIGAAAWRKDAAEYLPESPAVRHLYPAPVTAARFAPSRAPSHEELQTFRAELLALAGPDAGGNGSDSAGERLACHAVQCGFEFFSSAGLRDLLFHPQERTYTLLELKELLAGCDLECFGVTHGSLGADAVARSAFSALEDGTECLLERWHRTEEAHPGTFGRMHRLNCRAI
jgi:hypothetical protein